MKKKTVAFTLTTVVMVNLVVLLIVQSMADIAENDFAHTIWSVITFISVLLLAIYLLNICFEK